MKTDLSHHISISLFLTIDWPKYVCQFSFSSLFSLLSLFHSIYQCRSVCLSEDTFQLIILFYSNEKSWATEQVNQIRSTIKTKDIEWKFWIMKSNYLKDKRFDKIWSLMNVTFFFSIMFISNWHQSCFL